MADEIRTKEWLKSRFETGDVPTQEDYERLLDSYWHKTEMGRVARGEGYPVSGEAVAEAIEQMHRDIEERMRRMIAEMLPELLREALAGSGYVTSDTVNRLMQGQATQGWVREQLNDFATKQAVTDSLAEKVSTTRMTELLADKVDTATLTDRLSKKVDVSTLTERLAVKADTTAVYTKAQIDAAMSARPTQTESASETSTAINNAVADLPNNAAISALRTKMNDVISRVNTLSHVACGSATMEYCPADMAELQIPTP